MKVIVIFVCSRIYVEESGGCWTPDLSSNFDFVKDCVNAADSRGQAVGIYTSSKYWGEVCGNATGLQSYPLWYSDYDGAKNFDDFTPFGGWTSPAMKQYSGSSNCNVSSFADWYPGN